MPEQTRIAVIGLGYVGLPLAVALARRHRVTGFDIRESRIQELRSGHDRTGEVAEECLRASPCGFTADPTEIAGREIYIVTVPTPVDIHNQPDLSAVTAACDTVGRAMGKGAIVVFESTVYPGVTEEICGPALEAASGLTCGSDFFLGYSPERINPGDREHTVERITKVVAGQTSEVTERLAALYGDITQGGVFRARDIRTAEAAKVIENAQRDINIAFINEITMIFDRLGLSVYDVLAAAGSKWNFLDFKPGLVGGHCIGVDPFYLAHLSQALGHHPEIILSGRRINDGMGEWIAASIHRAVDGQAAHRVAGRAAGADTAPRRALILGLTFKENVPDLRNSRVVDIVAGLKERGYAVNVHDPLADPDEARQLYDIELMPELDGAMGYTAVVGAVAHDAYRDFDSGTFGRLLAAGGVLADVKGIWRDVVLPEGLRRWEL